MEKMSDGHQQKSWKASLPITFQLPVAILTAKRQQHLWRILQNWYSYMLESTHVIATCLELWQMNITCPSKVCRALE